MVTADRVTNAVCESDMGVRHRISIEYKEGSGDSGLSRTNKYNRSSKSDPSYGIHVATERLRLELSRLASLDMLDKIDREFLEWLRVNSFSISSFCYLGGETTTHLFPVRTLEFLEERIEYFKPRVGPAKDFLIWGEPIGISLDACRVTARELEREYINWYIREGLNSSSIDLMGSILNRVSSYILWLTRNLYKDMGMKETYWHGRVSQFTL